MHPVLFSLKRAFRASTQLAGAFLGRAGLTPARFDLLYCLQDQGRPCPTAQRTLLDRLGIAAPTLTRMLKRLEELGLVTRVRLDDDRRRKIVSLTSLGHARLIQAIRGAMTFGTAQLAVDSAILRPWWSPLTCVTEGATLERFLLRARRAFRDRATLRYRWAPQS